MRLSPHVLFVLEYYHPHLGGVETLFKNLVDQLAQQGYQITIVTNRYDRTLPKTEVSGAVTIKRYRFYNRYLFTFLAWIPVLRYARKADLIHTTSYNAAVPARIAAMLTGTKSVITFHEYWGELWERLPWISPLMKNLFRRFERMIGALNFEKFIAVSDYTAQSLIAAGVDPSRVTRIYNGIDYNQFEKRGVTHTEKFTFLFFGRVSYSKGVDILLDAIDLIVSNKIDCKIKLIIPSEETPIYKEIMERLSGGVYQGIIDLSHDLPFAKLKDEIAGADCVVIPSYSEGFCFAAVETMAIATPIISSGQGALAEVISGKHIVMESFDAQGLYNSMAEAKAGNWKSTPINQYPLQDTVDAYIAEYERLLSGN